MANINSYKKLLYKMHKVNLRIIIDKFKFFLKVIEDDKFVTKLGKTPPLVTFREDKGNETLKNIVKELKESIGVIDNIQQQQNLNDSITATSNDVHKSADAKHEVNILYFTFSFSYFKIITPIIFFISLKIYNYHSLHYLISP